MTTTSKSSTKAKTKTAKAKTKSTNKTAPKRAAAKSTSKTASKSAAVKKAAAKNIRAAREITVNSLLGLHTIAAGVYLLLLLAAVTLMNNVSYQLTLGYITKDELAGGLAPAVQGIYDIEIRWLVAATLLISAVFPVLYLTRRKNRYTNFVTNTRMLPCRWADFAITGALMTAVAALLSGVSDIPTLELIGGLVVATAALSVITERQNNTVSKPVRSAYYTSLFTGLLPWLLIAAYAVASVIYGTSRDWYVYALYAAVLGGFVLQARNLYKQVRGANYLMTERNYVVISMLTKAAFTIVLIAGLLREF